MPGMFEEGLDEGLEVEQQALNMGWVPQDKFKGDPEKWVDAEEFVSRAETLMPILRQNNKRLQRELLTRDQEIGNLKAKVDNATVALEKLEKHYTDANRRAVETAKRQLREEMKQAREDNDLDKEFELREQLDGIRQTERELEEADKNKNKKDPPSQPEDKTTPEFKEWNKENPWFGEDKKKTKAVVRIGEDLRDEGNTLEGREFLEECVRIYEEQFGDPEEEEEETPRPRRRQTSKVESSGNLSRSSRARNTWADLPKEAQQACLADVDTLVGEGKAFKDVDAWKKHYTSIYFSE